MRRQITAIEFYEERKGLDFDVNEVQRIVAGKDREIYVVFDLIKKVMQEHPDVANKFEFHEMTPAEKSMWWYKRLNYLWFKIPELRTNFFSPNPSLRAKWYWMF